LPVGHARGKRLNSRVERVGHVDGAVGGDGNALRVAEVAVRPAPLAVDGGQGGLRR
jgi:hypothetical protein